MLPACTLSPDVLEMLSNRGAVVALETTIITHGLPYPANLDAARRLERAVRDEGAVPATIGASTAVFTSGSSPMPSIGWLAGRSRKFRRTACRWTLRAACRAAPPCRQRCMSLRGAGSASLPRAASAAFIDERT